MFIASIYKTIYSNYDLGFYKVYNPNFTSDHQTKIWSFYGISGFYDEDIGLCEGWKNVQIRSKAHDFFLRGLQFYVFS